MAKNIGAILGALRLTFLLVWMWRAVFTLDLCTIFAYKSLYALCKLSFFHAIVYMRCLPLKLTAQLMHLQKKKLLSARLYCRVFLLFCSIEQTYVPFGLRS